MVFAAGLLADAVENMQELGWLPFLRHPLWNTSAVLNEDSSLGDVFHSLLGYADHPTVLQAMVWVTFVTVTATLFIRNGHRARTAAVAAPGAATVPIEQPGSARPVTHGPVGGTRPRGA
jgi:high-affinity iron transporter